MRFIADCSAYDDGYVPVLPRASVKNIRGLGCIYGRRKVILEKMLCECII